VTSRLEERYRRVLRLLPAPYRTRWEEDMVATYLAAAAAEGDTEDAAYLRDYGRPGTHEVLSVLALALRLRVGGVEAAPVARLWGDSLRAVALIGLLVHAVTSAIGIVLTLWLAGEVALLPAPPVGPAFHVPTGVWRMALEFVGLFAIAGFVALVVGQPRPARWLATVPLAIGWASTLHAAVTWPGGVFVTAWLMLLVDTGIVLAIWAFHRDAPPIHRRPWLTAFAVGLMLGTGYALALLALPVRQELRFTALDWPGLCALTVSAAAIIYLIARRCGVHLGPHWPLTLLLLAGAALALRTVSVAEYATQAVVPGVAVTICSVEAMLVLAACVPLAVLSRRGARAATHAPHPAPAPVSGGNPQ
jgi:hypothetical protein